MSIHEAQIRTCAAEVIAILKRRGQKRRLDLVSAVDEAARIVTHGEAHKLAVELKRQLTNRPGCEPSNARSFSMALYYLECIQNEGI